MAREIFIEVMFPKPEVGQIDLAKEVGEGLRERELIACFNIIPSVQSGYTWEGRKHFEPEIMLLAKTVPENFEAVRGFVLSKHPYDVPCIVSSYVIEQGHKPYLQWVLENSQAEDLTLQKLLPSVANITPVQSLGNGS